MIGLFLVSAGLVMVLLCYEDRHDTVRSRVLGLSEGTSARERDGELGRKLRNLLTNKVTAMLPRRIVSRIDQRLVKAGRPLSATGFVGIKVAAVVLACVYGGALVYSRGMSGLALVVVLIIGAVYVPEMWLQSLAGKRRRQIVKSLPDVIDLLCVSVEAGLSFDGAIHRVADKFGGVIGQEFREYLKEVRLGGTRSVALRHLGDRSGTSELRSLTAALVQAEQLGVGISRVLRIQSGQLREKRKQRAEEQAMKVPIKMLFPMVIFIFPAIFIVLLGPAVMALLSAFSG